MAISGFLGFFVKGNDGEPVEQAVQVGKAEPAGNKRQAGPVEAAGAGLQQAGDLEGKVFVIAEGRKGFAVVLDAGGGIEMGGQFFAVATFASSCVRIRPMILLATA
jgi:hypothetical protein